MTSATKIRTSSNIFRKPQAKSYELRDAITQVTRAYARMSVRQLFYQLVARGAIEKTERAYKRVCDTSAQMRLDGSLPYSKIVDGHRSRRIVPTNDGLREVLEETRRFYRRNYWLNQPVNVEVWCEKDALTGIIQPTCNKYGVVYVATRGFPSITLVYESALAMSGLDKPTYLYYFGDHDPSGRAISEGLEERLQYHDADVYVQRVALNPDQIAQFRLPTRPSKTRDSRYAGFVATYGDASVELDALPPNILTDLVEQAIREKIDGPEWARMERIERLERETLTNAVDYLNEVLLSGDDEVDDD